MTHKRITFIGAGNMARAIIGGLIADGYPASAIGATDIDPQRLQALTQQFGIHTGTENAEAVREADVIVLAVKPQVLREVAMALAPALGERTLVVSIAAGIQLDSLANWLGGSRPIVRVMPNTPALVGAGAAGLVSNAHVTEADREQAEALMRAVGLTVWLDNETLIDSVTALSGSGPAYVFLLMEAMAEAGEKLGIAPEQARLLTLQTVMGAAKLALESDVDAATLRRQVTSPGGTTEAAFKVFESRELKAIVSEALQAAATRSDELARMFGGN
ncbi:MAG: pyrroline-5-carboxylate reductase [Gammaproteobacteria bacterium]|nr:pyrroline-5-carboxylate reductase [Gammaproteobacteria bacterium]